MPHHGLWSSNIEERNGEIIPATNNGSADILRDILLEWGSKESNKKLIDILAKGGRLTGLEIIRSLFDLKTCFRKLGIA